MGNKKRFKIILLIFILFSIYTFIFSESGLLERTNLKEKYNLLHSSLTSLKNSNEDLKKKYDAYRAGEFSEQDIINSGLIYNGGKIIVFNENYNLKTGLKDNEPGFKINPVHLRIIWLIISVMILLYYINRLKQEGTDSDGQNS